MAEKSTSSAESPYFQNMEELLDLISRKSGIGQLNDAYLNMMRGINHRGLGNPVASTQDNTGIIFFTRPDLNLSYDNLAKQRVLMPLATQQDEPPTIQRAIRTLLDPMSNDRGITSPLIDELNPFMAVLTNNLVSLSGWPDINPETYSSKEGVMRESWSMLTGIAKHNGEFDLTASFRNTQGSPIALLILTWLYYMYGVRFENMEPYLINQINIAIDSKTRIYHFILDPGRQYIQHSAVTGMGGFPTTFPIGSLFNFTGGDTMQRSQEQLPVTFKCNVAEYNDPINFREFNRLVARFNPALLIVDMNSNGSLTTVGEQSETWVKIPRNLLKGANYLGTPLIHEDTGELFWYCSIENYLKLLGGNDDWNY
jgi:hypothetical protein